MDNFNERRRRLQRDRDRFDRTWRWVFPIALVLAVVGALVTLALYAGAAAWIWSQL
jgi:hypothetical protein